MAILITPTGEWVPVFPEDGRTFTPAELQQLVGERAAARAVPEEVQRMVTPSIAFCSQDDTQPRNALATALFADETTLVGPVLMCTPREAGEHD